MLSEKLFQVHDRDAVTKPGLLYYTKGMPTAMFSNVYTPIDLVNKARYISIGIVSDDDGMFNLRLVDNQANNCSNLLLTRCKYNFVQPSSKSCILMSVHSFQTCFSQA